MVIIVSYATDHFFLKKLITIICHAIMMDVMVFRYTSARGFILKTIQWHIHAGSWSLVNSLARSLYEALIRCS